MSGFFDRFAGMPAAEVKMGRIPNPKEGKSAILITSVRMKDNQGGGFRVEIAGNCLYGIDHGNDKGDKVQTCIFSSKYPGKFEQDFKSFLLAALDHSESQEKELADYVCPADSYPGMDDLDRINYMWAKKLPALVCAMDDEGKPTEAGALDGQVVVEINVVNNKYNQKIDPKGADEKSNWVHDSDGNPIEKSFSNCYFNRRIPFSEVEEKLDEQDVRRFFGSAEKLKELKATD